MCGRYRLDLDWTEIVRLYRLQPDDDLRFDVRYNVAPTQLMPVLVVGEHGLVARRMRWGLLAPWAKALSDGARCINARAETAATAATFRVPFQKRRALVPTTGFYEWKKGPGKQKTPLLLRPTEGPLLTLAGLWQPWRNPANGEWIDTFTILTVPANRTMAPIHDRMPAVLRDPEAQRAWLDPATPVEALHALLAPAPDDALRPMEVSPAVGNVANDSAEAAAVGAPWEPAEPG